MSASYWSCYSGCRRSCSGITGP
ncbi:hypothetical protein [Alteromonas sp. H39]